MLTPAGAFYTEISPGLYRVTTRAGGQVTACARHVGPARVGQLAHTMPMARRIAEGWIRRHTSKDCNAAVFALGILYQRPGCCPAGDWAQSNMMAAFRELTRGDWRDPCPGCGETAWGHDGDPQCCGTCGTRVCPRCGADFAEDYDGNQDRLSDNLGDHQARWH